MYLRSSSIYPNARFHLTPLSAVLIDSTDCLLSRFLFVSLSCPAPHPVTTHHRNRSQHRLRSWPPRQRSHGEREL
ncbi:hypothetical protein BDM02DRAFT_3120172, partial [Thelephora ganbajun]